VSDDKQRLLIVEDDPGLQKQLRWCFDDIEVLQATNRAEALAQLRRHEPTCLKIHVKPHIQNKFMLFSKKTLDDIQN
jgi:ActR/RegA family two-component response regulator